ncbi:MAG: class I SAM-dependent methyltransferase [Candidatus Sericytochromatia bacterium]|nr:class I SAM-dependent methyltransferase [Candidatus Sericytochromatia bacterium]
MSDPFAEKADEYDHKPLPQQISEGVSAALLARVPLEPDLVVLDFGAGTGLLSGRLAPHVARIVAADVSPAMLAQLAAKPALRGIVEPVCQDLLQTPLGYQVDLVVSAMAMHHVADTATLLRTFFEHLRPGGRLAVADLDAEEGDFHPPETEGVFHHGFRRETLLQSLREAGFSNLAVETACEIARDGRLYSIFLATATRPA